MVKIVLLLTRQFNGWQLNLYYGWELDPCSHPLFIWLSECCVPYQFLLAELFQINSSTWRDAAFTGTTAMRAIELFRSDESSPGDLNVSAMLVCIEALQKMLTGQYLELEVCPVSICIEALEMLISILQQVSHRTCNALHFFCKSCIAMVSKDNIFDSRWQITVLKSEPSDEYLKLQIWNYL